MTQHLLGRFGPNIPRDSTMYGLFRAGPYDQDEDVLDQDLAIPQEIRAQIRS